MKALTIYGIYADCTAAGVKTIEHRSWKTDYRGELLICSAALNQKVWRNLFVTRHAICTVELIDCVPFAKPHREGYYFEPKPSSGYAWILDNVRLIEPIYIKGQQRLFNADVEPKYLDIDYKQARQYWLDLGLISALSI